MADEEREEKKGGMKEDQYRDTQNQSRGKTGGPSGRGYEEEESEEQSQKKGSGAKINQQPSPRRGDNRGMSRTEHGQN